MIEPSTTTALIRQTCDSIAEPAGTVTAISFGTESLGTEIYTWGASEGFERCRASAAVLEYAEHADADEEVDGADQGFREQKVFGVGD
jgi:hypothetical protein